nr:alpha-hydroxy-acid oxidizing protein [Listeria floridensis]
MAFDFLTNWGLTTAESLLDLKATEMPNVEILASGGIKSALDMVKCYALGAKAAGIAGKVLYRLKKDGLDAAIRELNLVVENLTALFVLLDARNLDELKSAPLLVSGELKDFCEARGITLNER